LGRHLIVSDEARDDIREAAAWYEERRRGLSRPFLSKVKAALRSIRAHPYRYAYYDEGLRHCVLKGLPFSLLFHVEDEKVVVVSCFHGRRDPEDWKQRLR
jgi:plasmid stabilization system protein ParE